MIHYRIWKRPLKTKFLNVKIAAMSLFGLLASKNSLLVGGLKINQPDAKIADRKIEKKSKPNISKLLVLLVAKPARRSLNRLTKAPQFIAASALKKKF